MTTRQVKTYTLDHQGRRSTTAADPGGGILVLALECDRPLEAPSRHQLAGIEEVSLARAEVRAAHRAGPHLSLGIPDPWMSQMHARLVQDLGRWVLEDLGSKNGTIVNGVPRDLALLEDGDLVELGHTLLLFREAGGGGDRFPADCSASSLAAPVRGLPTFSAALAESYQQLTRVVAASLPVVVQGQSGTGKELVARAVHELSGRTGPFVPVNCGALPSALVESELFGHRKGAFSGAVEDRPGFVRSAHMGTLFLDELADLPAQAQVAMLRVLQEREVTPVGSSKPIPVDIQIVAATQRGLADLVDEGKLREDLYARLSGFCLRLPRLADRREDLGILIGALLGRIESASRTALRIDCLAARALFRHDWPLNVRELERALGLGAALAEDGVIRLEHLPPAVRGESDQADPLDPSEPDEPLSAAEQERRDWLAGLLREHDGNVSAVARASGKARAQIQRWLKRYGLDPRGFRR